MSAILSIRTCSFQVRKYLSSVSYVCLALAAATTTSSTAHAANFTASNQAELVSAINQANASGDANSTITLTSDFTVAANSLPPVTANLTIDTGGNTLRSNGNITINVAAGTELTLNGSLVANGSNGATGAVIKSGDGTLNISGGSGASTWYTKVSGGNVVFKDGANFSYADDTGATQPLLGTGTTVTVTGAGTILNARGSLKGGGTLNIENGGRFSTENSTSNFTRPASLDGERAAINITGNGSSFAGGIRVEKGYLALNLRDGGTYTGNIIQIGTSASTTAVSPGLRDEGGSADILVSDTGTTMTVTNPILLGRGSLSILNGGVVTAGGMRVGSFDRPLTKDAVGTVLVSGAGSVLNTTQTIANSFIVGGGAGAGVKNGTLTVSNQGKVTAAAGVGTINVATTAGSTGTINIGGETDQAAAHAGTIEAGVIQFGAGNGTLNFNHTDADYTFSVALKGNGSVNQIGSGKTVLNTDQTGFTGKTFVKAGTLAVNSKLGGTMNVAGGRLQGIGTVGSTINEAGGIIAPGNDTLGTLTIDGNYEGKGGTIAIRTVLGDDHSETDQLVITGDTSGNSAVRVTNFKGEGALTSEGIRIIQVGGQSDGAFTLNGDYALEGQQVVVAGAYAYALHKNGINNPQDGSWYLRSKLLPVPEVPEQPTGPLYQAGIPVYEAYAQGLLNANRLPTLQQRVGNRYWNGATTQESGHTESASAVWGRVEGSHTRFDPKTTTTLDTYDVDVWKMQAGLDGLLIENDKGKLIGGLTVHYANISTDIASFYGNGSIKTDGWGLGGTLTWYGNDGFYVDGQTHSTWYNSDLNSNSANAGLTNSNDAFGYAFSVETGQRFGVTDGWTLTPQAQLAYSAVDFDSFNDRYGADISLDRGNSLLGRLGLSADYEANWTGTDGKITRNHVYGIANLYQEFLNGSRISVADTGFATENERTWGGIGTGGSYDWANGKYKLYGEVSVNTSLKNFGDSYSVNGTAGFKVAF